MPINKAMYCRSFIKTLSGVPNVIVSLIQIYNITINILNVVGNALLIWALRRTKQTKTISFQFIMIMSFSDLTIGVLCLPFLTLVLYDEYQKYCWLMLLIQTVLSSCNYFSGSMVFLIALDRYLHMKYLEQYSRQFTKRRGHFLIIAFVFLALFSSIVFILPLSHVIYSTLVATCFVINMIFSTSIIILYHKALSTLKRKAHMITSSLINKDRTLGKAAKRISLCIIVLSGPIIICSIIDGVNMRLSVIDPSVMAVCIWFAYITFLGNGFCSSFIFISQNTPIKRFLRKVATDNWNRIRSLGGRVGTYTRD